MKLSNTAVTHAKPKDKAYKLFDGDGLYLLVKPTGGKYWRFKYRFAAKDRELAFGTYPEVSLADAREKRREARKQVAAGTDPGETKRQVKRDLLLKAEMTFEALSREWYEQNVHTWTEKHAKAVITRLEADIFPEIGNRPIADLYAPEILAALRLIEKRGALDLTQTVAQYCRRIFAYAIATGRAERNPVADLKGALKPPVRTHHAYLQPNELPEYLKKLEGYDGTKLTKLALKMLLLTFVRTTELRGAEWAEIDLEKAEWRIPASRMKMKDPHIVPLSTQAVAILQELKQMSGKRVHVFPNEHKPTKFMSENTMLYALYRMGYHSRTTGHGFRATASTILNEHGFHSDHIELQLAHVERNKVRSAYNHAQHLQPRREMMQWWANYLDTTASGQAPDTTNVVAGKFRHQKG